MTDSQRETGGPTVAAKLIDGPLAGTTVTAYVVEGRPPKTIDVEGPDRASQRYCLAEWEQTGNSADYTFLYEV
jgi:hypothetical protein